MCLQYEFVIFWQKDFGAKAAHKMFVKLTPGRLFQSSLILARNQGTLYFLWIVTV
jgi:hypothetical protein